MNISRMEQRVLHVLAQGGHIRHDRDDKGRIVAITCFTRDGYGFSECTFALFQKLKGKRLIESKNGQPYRISFAGRRAVQARPDNR